MKIRVELVIAAASMLGLMPAATAQSSKGVQYCGRLLAQNVQTAQPTQTTTRPRGAFHPAQPNPGEKPSTLPARNMPFHYGSATISDTTYEHLTSAPNELPGMTQITPPGSRFEFAMKKVNDKGITTLNMQYQSTEQAEGVVQYYSQAFKQPGWRLLRATDRQVEGQYLGNSCSITVTRGASRQYPTDIAVVYRLRINN